MSDNAGANQNDEQLLEEQEQQPQENDGDDDGLTFDLATTPLNTLNSTQLRALLAKKQKQMAQWESEMASAMGTLAVEGNVGLRARLVDGEGFPRDDIDVTAVRQARHTVATRRNDLAAIGEDLKQLLELIFAAQARERGEEESPEAVNLAREAARRARKQQQLQEQQERLAAQNGGGSSASVDAAAGAAAADGGAKKVSKKRQAALELAQRWDGCDPICTVRDVSANSPAFMAGLRDGDRMVAVAVDTGKHVVADGSVAGVLTQARGAGIADVAGLVRANEGVPLRVVLRQWNGSGNVSSADDAAAAGVTETVLVPLRWSGNGLLGCALE